MKSPLTAIIEADGRWFVASSPEVPGANGQGRTAAAAKRNLAAAVRLVLADRRTPAPATPPA